MNSDIICENSPSYDGDTISWPSVHNDFPVINLETRILLDHPSHDYTEITLAPAQTVTIPCYFDGDTSSWSSDVPASTSQTTIYSGHSNRSDTKMLLSPRRPTCNMYYFAFATLAVALLALIFYLLFVFFT